MRKQKRDGVERRKEKKRGREGDLEGIEEKSAEIRAAEILRMECT